MGHWREREKKRGAKGYLISRKDAKKIAPAAFSLGGRDECVEPGKTQVYAVGRRRVRDAHRSLSPVHGFLPWCIACEEHFSMAIEARLAII